MAGKAHLEPVTWLLPVVPLRPVAFPLFLTASVLLVLPAAAHVGPIEAPPEAFCIVVIEPTDSFRLVRITVDEKLKADAKQDSWDVANANGDASLSAQELEGFRQGTLQFWPGGREMGNRSVWLTPDAPYERFSSIRPVYASTWRHVGHGFYADAVSTHTGATRGDAVGFDEFETQAVREYAYHVMGQISRMTVHGGQAMAENLSIDTTGTPQPKPVIEYVVVKAPEGWRIRHIQGYGYGGLFALDFNNETVELRGFDTSAPWSIQYVHPEADENLSAIDGPGPSGLLAVLVGMMPLAWWRRRQHSA